MCMEKLQLIAEECGRRKKLVSRNERISATISFSMVHFSACFFRNRCACFFSFEQLLSTLSLTRHERALRFTCRRATSDDKSFNFISTRNRLGKF